MQHFDREIGHFITNIELTTQNERMENPRKWRFIPHISVRNKLSLIRQN